MKPILYPSSATSFNNQGLGALSDAISCVVSEERNGEYELTLEYPVGGIHFDEIGDRAIILAIPSPYRTPQPFRIYSVESPLNGIVTIHAHHLSYDLSGIPVSPFTADSCSTALSGLLSHSVVTNPFTVWTDKSVSSEYKLSVPTSFRACLGGQEGSILDVYGKGEYEFDKYAVKLHLNRGSDNGVKIAYGKNLTDFRMERNLESVVTGIYPYWANVDEDEVIEGDLITIYDINNPAYLLESGGAYLLDSNGKYLLVQNPFPFNNVLPLDLSSEFESAPTKAELKERAEKYIRDNGLGVPKVSIDVSFVQLEQTEEYKDIAVLEACDLCDTVTVDFPLYGISAKAEIIRIETDVLLERYNSVQIGDARTSLADTLAHLEVNSMTKAEIKAGTQKAADVINNTKGIFEFISNDDGTNGGFIIHKADNELAWLKATAGGIGVSNDGGLTYTNALTENGVVASKLSVIVNGETVMSTNTFNNRPALCLYDAEGRMTLWLRNTITSANKSRAELTLFNPNNGEGICTISSGYVTDTGEIVSSSFRLSRPSGQEGSFSITAEDNDDVGLTIFRSTGYSGIRLGIHSDDSAYFYYDGHTLSFKTITVGGTTYHVLGY